MALRAAQCLTVSDRPNDWHQHWPPQAREQAVALHGALSIGERDWHALKAQRSRRAAELLAAALVQLLSGDAPGRPQSSEARSQALAMVEQAERWLKAEISDPGCGHRRG